MWRVSLMRRSWMKFVKCKWELIRWGFEAIQDAIYFRFTLEDNIDRCAFFEELSKGWYEMYIWTEEEK
jgi:hypothetical protein